MRRFLLTFVLTLACAGPVLADSDQDRARRAVESGAVRPFGEILSIVRRSYPGRVLDAGIGEVGGRWFYDIRLLGSGGQVTELRVDADSAEVMGVRGGGRRQEQRPEPQRAERGSRGGGLPTLGFDREERRSGRSDDADRRGGRGQDNDSGKGRGKGGGRD